MIIFFNQPCFAFSQDSLSWCLKCIDHYFRAGYLKKGDMSLRAMTGEGAGGRGLLDTFAFKLDLRYYLLGGFLDDHIKDATTRSGIQAALASHESHRRSFGWPLDETQPDLTWHASWKESERNVLFLLEAESFVLLNLTRLCVPDALVIVRVSSTGAGTPVRKSSRQRAQAGNEESQDACRDHEVRKLG